MSAFLATFRRELHAYFFSPLAYVVLFFLLVVNGITFSIIVSILNDPRAATGRPLDLFFGGTFLYWVILLFVGPVLTMRLVSEELRSGSIEVLMTAPITEIQVVLGKYLAALTFYVVLWLPTVSYGAILSHYSTVDWGPIVAGYLGTFLIGALFLAVGIFASAMTRSQLLAAIISFALLMLLLCAGLLENFWNSEAPKQAFGYVNLIAHMEDFAKGIVDTRRIVYYLSAIAFFLFLTSRALEDRKWR